MEYELDPVKDEENRTRDGFSLGLASLVFVGRFVEEEDRRRRYGEQRFVAVGPIQAFGNRLVVVVYTWRGDTRQYIASGKPMTEKRDDTISGTLDEARRLANEMATPEFLAWLDGLTNEDIAAQIAANPDAAPELTEEWFENARLVIPLKGRRVP